MKVIEILGKDHFLDPTDALEIIRYANENNDYLIDFDGVQLYSNTILDMVRTALQDKQVEIVNLK